MTSNPVVLPAYNDVAAACAVQPLTHQGPASHTLRYSACCRQLEELGGDCYGFIPLSGSCLALFIADASGKGLPAALSIAGVERSLRTAIAFAEDDPAAVVDVVNRQLYACSETGRYATLFLGVFDQATGTLHYVNAGHNPPLLVRRDGAITLLDDAGFPVGMFPDYTYAEVMVQLRPGDLVVAYTDGVTEASDADGEELGLERVARVAAESLEQHPDRVAKSIFDTMDEFSVGQQRDDATVLVLRVD